ncbi:MAG: hypothetical protein QOH24_584, partial [Verrucomicrobiota bacterium]
MNALVYTRSKFPASGRISFLARRVALPLLFLGAGLVLVQPSAAATGVFNNTGSLNTGRYQHTATLLQNGMVLVAGGFDSNGNASTSAELYNPASGIWAVTGNLNTGRDRHTATLLSNGMVLVAGGADSSGNAIVSAELYDPASGTWTATGNLNTSRHTHTATLLSNGKVLVAGGNNGAAITSAELFDPASGTWIATGSLNTGRARHTATLIASGMVLIAGGLNISNNASATAELYDSASGSWIVTGSLNTARDFHTATLLTSGMVLVAGGLDSSNNASASTELYDSVSGSWTVTGSLNTAHARHTATLLTNGMALVAGGLDSSNNASASAELYDSASGSWTATGSVNTARARHTATLLLDGKVLAAGGQSGTGGVVASAELYDPGITSPSTATATEGHLFVYQIVASNSPTSYSARNLPPGLTIDTTNGVIGGVPTQSGSSSVTINAIGASATDSAILNLTINPLPSSGPVITSTTSVTGRTGQFFAFQVLAMGLSPAARASAAGLPPGLQIDDISGLISGTPTTDGSFTATIAIVDGNNTVLQTLELTFTSNPAIPVITSPSTAALTPGQPFSYTIVAPTVTDPSDHTIFSIIGTLPAGLTFDPATGTISGTPTSRQERVHTLTPLIRALDDTPIVGVVQLVASNAKGTATKPLVFVPPASNPLVNISTRLQVGTADNVMIGGFVISGTEPKRVVLRAIGASLGNPPFNLTNVLANPTIKIFDSTGSMIALDDDWADSQKDDLIASGRTPTDAFESAVLIVLNPGSYTAIVSGNSNTTGV